MNHKFEHYFKDVIILHVSGRKIDRFLLYLYKLKINILKIDYIDRQNIKIKVFYNDVDRIMSMKTSYKVEIVDYEYKLRLKQGIKKHFFLLISILCGYLFLLLLSNIILNVEVIHSNESIRRLIIAELEERNIRRWRFKQNFAGIKRIKEEILNEHKDRIEWLEIENIGVNYIVKVEERKIKEVDPNYQYQDIVSSKNAIILKIEATEGEIVKRRNDYVKKGDILISGRIMKGDEVVKLIKANGKIYGEVWYNIKVEHPIIYQTKKNTGREKNVYQIIFLNHRFSLFDTHPFENKNTYANVIISHPLIPFQIVKEKQNEVIMLDEIYTDSEALIKAEQIAIKKMEEYLDEDEHIISYRKLKYNIVDDKLLLEMFFKTYESIGVPRVITE